MEKKGPIVSVKNFHMEFGSNTVIEDLSFEVERGEVFGFLGANGSGKTTTIRTLLGIYQPTRGELLVNGSRFNPEKGDSLSYLPEERGLYKKESVLDTMIYFGRLKNLSREEAKKYSLDYLDRVGLGDKANEKLGKLSGGQQQKVQLGVTVMNNPELLILDEPTKGLDPMNRRLMADIIDEGVKNGATVILVTHHMDEVERLCNRIMLLKDGVRRLYGKIEEVREEHGGNVIQLQFHGALPENQTLYEIGRREGPSRADLHMKEGVKSDDVLAFLSKQNNLSVKSYQVGLASLEDLFIDIYQEKEDKPYA